MITRSTARSAAFLLALTLTGTVIAASVRMNPVSQQIATVAAAGIDIPALTTTVDTATLPLLSVHDPI